ncbi:MAG: AsmA family protein, partial [Planctomycetota bacterium]
MVVDARLRELRVPERAVAEERIDLAFSVRRDESGYGIERLQLSSASEEFELKGTGTVPATESAEGSLFYFEGRAPARLFFKNSGTVRFLVQGSGEKGCIRFDQLLFGSPEMNLSGSGSIQTQPPHTGEITGNLSGNIDEAYQLIRALLPAAPLIGIAGDASLPELRFEVDETGRLRARAKGSVQGLVLSGVLEKELRRESLTLDIDAIWDGDRDLLTVSRGRIDNLQVWGQMAGRPARIEGTVKGEIELEPWMAGAAGLEWGDLAGRLTIDAAAETGGNEIRVRGEATIEGLRVDQFAQKKAFVQGNLVRVGTAWSGKGNFVLESGSGSFDLRDLAKERLALEANVTVPDIRTLLDQVPHLALPEQLSLAGNAQARVTIRREGSGLTGAVSVLRSKLTALWEDKGVREESVTLNGTFQREDGRWQFDGLNLRSPPGQFQLHGSSVTLGPDGSFKARLRGWLRAQRSSDLLPDLKRFEPEGHVGFDLDIGRQKSLTIDGTLEGKPLHVTVDGKRLGSKTLSLTASAAQTGDGWNVESFSLDVDGSRLAGSARVSERIEVEFKGDGESAGLIRFVEGVTGSGAYDLSGSLRAPRPGEQGPLELRCILDTAALGIAEFDLRNPHVELTLKGMVRESGLEVGTSRLDATAELARHGSVQLSGCRLGTTGEGADGRIHLKTSLTVDQIRCDQLPIHGIEVRAVTELPELSGGALRRATSRGNLTFRSVAGRSITWQEGRAELRLREGVLELTDLVATANEGTLTCNGSIDLRTDPPAWDAKLKASGVRLSPELGRPLSHVVPILRLATGGKRSL